MSMAVSGSVAVGESGSEGWLDRWLDSSSVRLTSVVHHIVHVGAAKRLQVPQLGNDSNDAKFVSSVRFSCDVFASEASY